MVEAVRIWEPFDANVVFQEIWYGEDVTTEPKAEPSSRNWTEEMEAGLTAEDEAETVIVEETVAPFDGAVMLTEGAEFWVYTYAPISQPVP